MLNKNKAKPTIQVRERTFSGCWACRLKKRRCDELRPQCTLCARHSNECSYDIRLMWLPENLLCVRPRCTLRCRTSNSKWVRQRPVMVAHSSLKGYGKQYRKMSREDFIQMTNSRETSLLGSSVVENESFTISVRRFKIYDNCIPSVFGKRPHKTYDRDQIEKRLDTLLKTLELDATINSNASQGPFLTFPQYSTNSSVANMTASGGSKGPLKTDSGYDWLLEFESDGPFDRPGANSLSPSPSSSYSSIDDSHTDSEATKTLQRDLFEKLQDLIHEDTQVVFSRSHYCKWFMQQLEVNWKFLESPLDNVQLQALKLTLLILTQGKKLLVPTEKWVLQQSKLLYSMYPVVNFVLHHSQSAAVIHHCNNLLSHVLIEDYHEDHHNELTYELLILANSRVVDTWKSKILDQLCHYQDATQACLQLKYWEFQLKCNKQFYRDVYQ